MEKYYSESDIKKWLTVALAQENLEKFSVKITGSSEKGDGFGADIIFVTVAGTKAGKDKEYNLVLKCSQSSAAWRGKVSSAKKIFNREAYIYQNVVPQMKQFHVERGVDKPFDSVPKCYGVYSDEVRYVIVMENLKKLGYGLWPKAKPLTREAINIVMKDYAKFHATSVALNEQDPERFQKWITNLKEDPLEDPFKEVLRTSSFLTKFQAGVEEVYQMLTDDVENDILEKWLKLKEHISFIFLEKTPCDEDVQVINHGDCWMNNFLYKFENEERLEVSKVAILDWQMSKLGSPMVDLSYFLFAGISEEDIADMNTILRDYYQHFSKYLTEMGSNFSDKYTIETFFDEWKKYVKVGAVRCILPIKFLYTEKENLPDVAKAAESGADIGDFFQFELGDKAGFKNRLKPIVKYVVENGLI